MRRKILSIIQDVLKQQKIDLKVDNSICFTEFKALGVDSITVLNIIVCIEKKLQIRLDDNDLMKIKTINQLIEAFENKTK